MANKKTTTNVKNNVVTKNVADEKKTVPVVKQDVKVAEPKKAEPVKTEVKPAEVKPAEVKPAEVKLAEVKKTDVKTEEAKATDSKKAEAKKPVAKKPVKKEITQTVYVQYAGKNVAVDEMMPKIKKVWQKAGNKIKDIKDVKLYVKPEDNKVYFVINEEFCDSVEFE